RPGTAERRRGRSRRGQPARLAAATLVLRLNRGAESLVLVEVGTRPDAFEQIEPEIAPKSFLDHVAVTTAAPRGLDADGAKHPLVQRDRRPSLRHSYTIASICTDARIFEPSFSVTRHISASAAARSGGRASEETSLHRCCAAVRAVRARSGTGSV